MNSENLMTVPQVSFPRNKKALTLAERIQVIQEYEKTPNTRYLARLFGCGRTQIQNILRHRQEYLDEWENDGDPYRVRRRQSVQLLTLGAIVYEWVQRCRSHNIIITDDLIRQTGQRVGRLLNMTDFRPSNRWLERLKSKYKFCSFDLLGLDPTVTGDGIEKKSLKLEDIIEDLRDPCAENNFLVLPKIKQYQSNMLGGGMFNGSSNNVAPLVNNSSEKQMDTDCVYVLSDSGQSDTSDNEVSFLNVETAGNPEAYEGVNRRVATGITTYKEALNHLGPLEQFALMAEDIRAIGLINQLENIFTEKMQLKEK